jgi:hypothetical protein
MRAAIVLALLVARAPGAAPAADPMAAYHHAALEFAGQWKQEGFRVRDSRWTGTFTPGKTAVIRVSLLAGNRYWFSAAAGSAAGGISVSIFSEDGTPAAIESRRDGSRAAAGFEPPEGGVYFVRIEPSQASAAPFCLVLSYK